MEVDVMSRYMCLNYVASVNGVCLKED